MMPGADAIPKAVERAAGDDERRRDHPQPDEPCIRRSRFELSKPNRAVTDAAPELALGCPAVEAMRDAHAGLEVEPAAGITNRLGLQAMREMARIGPRHRVGKQNLATEYGIVGRNEA